MGDGSSAGGLWMVSVLRNVAAYAVFPNVLFMVGSLAVSMVRAPINVDYMIVAVISWKVRRSRAVALFATIALLDLFRAIVPVFYFRPGDVALAVSSIRNVPVLPVAAVLLSSALAGVLLALVAVWLAGRRPAPVSARLAVLVAVILVSGADVWNGTSRFRVESAVRVPVNLATSSVYTLSHDVWSRTRDTDSVRPTPRASAVTMALGGPLDQVARRIAKADVANFALVMVEAYGLFDDTALNAGLLRPYLTGAVQDWYAVSSGAVEFSGPTVAGELRELCAVSGSIRLAIEADLPACLPALLRRAGFRTIAVHGYRGDLFARRRWYPRIGFDEQFFKEELERRGQLRHCGVLFRGVCDVVVAQTVATELRPVAAAERRFVYWLTLDSHFPLALDEARESDAECPGRGAMGAHGGVCAYLRIIERVHRAVAAIALDARIGPTIFLVVGDHAPVALYGHRSALRVSQTSVPYILLTPRRPSP